MDLAHLGIKIDYADIDKAVNKLKELEKVSSTVEKQTKGISFAPKSNTELNKLNAELKALNKQAQILGETSSVSAREVDRLAAKLKYLEKQASLKGLSQGNRELQTLIRQTGQSIDNLTGKIKTSDNIVKRWWKRFGEVGVGFTLIYQTVNLVTGAIHSLNQVILDGIKLSGELVSAQAKLSMWLEMGSQGAISFQEAMNVSKQTIQALADASLTSTSTLKELATGLDEVSQAGVFISKDVMPKFADLIDFTKMVAETTGSTTRQIRQELQALMQGQVKTTNLLIRTAQQLHILTDEDIQGLKEMQNRQEVIEKLSESISSYWEKVKEVIISADVNTAFDKWYDSLTRLVTKATELTSETQGTMNIFGATIYKHIQELNKELQNMNVEKYENFFLGLNIALDKFLTLAEKAVKGLMSIDISTDSVNLKFKELENFLKGVLTPFQLFYKIAKDLDDKLVDLTGALEDMGIHLVSIHKIVGEAFVYRLIFGNWKAGFVLAILTEIDNLISDIIGEGEKSHSIINSLKGAAEYGIIGTYLFGWEAGLTIGALKLVVDYLAEIRKAGDEGRRKSEGAVNPYIQEHLDKYLSEKYPTTPGELEKWRKKMDEEFDKAVKKYKKAIEEINNALKKLKEDTELEEYAQKVKESLITPIEKLIQEKTKLDKLVEAGKISHEQELEYLAKEAKGYYNLKSPIEKVMEILSGAPNTWDKNLQALKNNEQAVDDFIKYLQDLEKYAQQLETSAQTPLQKFISGFEKLQETEALVGLSDKAYAEGLLELSKNIVDTTNKEDLLREAFALYADELKQMPAEEVAAKIKELAKAFDTHESAWQKGIKAYIDDIKTMDQVITDIVHKMFSELEDMLTHFITSGEISIKNFTDYIINQIARIYVQQYMMKPLAQYMYNIIPTSSGGQFGGSGFSFNNIPWSSLGNIFSTSAAPLAASSAFSNLSLIPATTTSSVFNSLSLMPSATGTTTSAGAFSNLSLMPAATTPTTLSFSQALPYAGWSALGYSTLGNWVGLPQSQYSPYTAGAGGMGGALLASSFAVNPIIGGIGGALLGGVGGGLLGQSHIDDVDLHIYFGNPNESYPQDYSGLRQKEFFEWDRAINDFMSVNIRKGSSMSDEQARQLEQAISNYFQGLFDSIETQFGISVKDVLEGQAVGFHENDYSGDLQATLAKYTDEFFKNFTDELTESILGYSIDYDTLKKFQESGEAISDTFLRVVGSLKEIPHASELIVKYLTQTESSAQSLQELPESAEDISNIINQSGSEVVDAYNKLITTWTQINDLVDTAFQNMTFPESVEDFTNQLTTNIRLEVTQALEQSYMNELAEQTKEWLLEKFGITDWSQLIENLQNGTIALETFNDALDELADSVSGTANDVIQQANTITSQIAPEQPIESDNGEYSSIQEALDAGDYNAASQMLFPFAQTTVTYSYTPEPTQDTTQQQIQSILEDLQKIDITQGWKDFAENFMNTIKDSITEQLQSNYISKITGNINNLLQRATDFSSIDDFIRQVTEGNLSIDETTSTLRKINKALESNKDIYDRLFISLVSIGEIDLSGILDKIPEVSEVLNNYITATNSSLVEAYEELVEQWDYLNELISESLQQIENPFDGNFKQQFLTSFKQQIGKELTQQYYQDIGEQMTSYILSTFGLADYTELSNAIYTGELNIEDFINALNDMGNVIDANSDKLDELLTEQILLGNIDISWVDNILNISQIVQDYMDRTGETLTSAYEELSEEWDYIYNLVSQSFQNITLPFDTQSLEQQFFMNFQQNLGNQILQAFYEDLSNQITGAILSEYGVSDLEQLTNWLLTGELSLESFNNALVELGSILEQNTPKIEHLKQVLEKLGIFTSYYEQQYEQAKADYINALQAEISDLQQKQQELEQNFQKAKQDYLNALQEEINKNQEAANSAKRLIETFGDLIESINSYRDELVGDTLSPSTYNYARAQFLDLISNLNTSDTDVLQETLSKLPESASAFLEQSKQYNTYEQYLKDYYLVMQVLNEAQDKAVDIQEEQQDLLNSINETLKELTEKYDEVSGKDIKDLADAAEAYYEAKLALDNSQYTSQIEYYQNILATLQDILDVETAAAAYNTAYQSYVTHTTTTSPMITGGETTGSSAVFPFEPSMYGWSDEDFWNLVSTTDHDDLADMLRKWGITAQEYSAWLQSIGIPVPPLLVEATYHLPYDYSEYFDPSQYGWTDQDVINFLGGLSTGQLTTEDIINAAEEVHVTAGALAAYARHLGYNLTADDIHNIYGIPYEYFAEGGTVYKPTLAVVGEAGVEHITPDSQMKEVKEKLGEIKEILWMMLNTTGDNKKVLIKLNNLVTGWDYEGLPATRE